MSEFMEGKLIESILIFPKMLDVRPIVVNEENVVFGGNQRVACLKKIYELEEFEIFDYLNNQRKFRLSSTEDQQSIIGFWKKWQATPVVPARVLEGFTKEEQSEFLVKDNLHYGEDDVEILKDSYDKDNIMDYFGSVPWNLFDYSDRINDDELDIARAIPEYFKCGYVQCSITNEELKDLNDIFTAFKAEHEDNSDGFLTYLLGIEEEQDEQEVKEDEEIQLPI